MTNSFKAGKRKRRRDRSGEREESGKTEMEGEERSKEKETEWMRKKNEAKGKLGIGKVSGIKNNN